MGVKGSGAITDMVDTTLSIWRNKPKEEKIRKLESIGGTPEEELLGQPDAVLACHKQRNGEDEPKAALWFDK
jgi:twinkle protein